MTGTEIITQFEVFVDDDLDADLELQLVNDAMHAVEEEVQPQVLKKVSTSLSTSAGQTYTTSRALPSDFFIGFGYLYVGTQKYTEVPLEQQVFYRDQGGYFWIDHANSVFYLSGTQASAQTISFPYLYKTTDLSTSTSPVWPSRFHRLIALKMARQWFAIDQGDKSISWRPEWEAEYQEALNRFREWDARLKLAAIGHSAPYGAVSQNEGPLKINLP